MKEIYASVFLQRRLGLLIGVKPIFDISVFALNRLPALRHQNVFAVFSVLKKTLDGVRKNTAFNATKFQIVNHFLRSHILSALGGRKEPGIGLHLVRPYRKLIALSLV